MKTSAAWLALSVVLGAHQALAASHHPEATAASAHKASAGATPDATSAPADCEALTNETNDDPWKARRKRYRAIVERYSERYGVDPGLIDAVITVESGYNPRSVNRRSGAAGLMQLMPETARRYGVKNVFSPEQNIRAGTRYLSELLDMFDNDERLALAAYLAGEGAVEKYGSIPPYRAAQHYVVKVIGYYHKFRCAT